jgi:hypothetical protein
MPESGIQYDDGYDDVDDSDLIDEDDVEDTLEELDAILDDIGPPAVLEAIAGYMYELPRPFHRVAKKLNDLAARARRAIGAVEEGQQTRGITE